ncbi:MAG: hypothetical protein WAO21_05715 [Verrucomicrobiia bacterium]
MNTNIIKRIHINPQSKGSLGKSFEAEFRTAWLDYHGIQWNGSDLDDRHHSFADRHPDQVQSYKLGSEDESKSTLLGLFRNVSRNDAPVHVIDCRAQADGLIVQALDSLQIISSLATEGIRFTFFLFPSEDTESMNNLLELFYFAGDRVDYVIVHNPAKVRTNLFKKSNIEAELKKFGAREITLPTVTSITLLAIKRAEAKAGRKLSFAEAATPGAPHLELMLAGEMQWAMQQMFRQYDLIADLLVPSEQMPELEPQTEPAAESSRPKQPMFNLGE